MTEAQVATVLFDVALIVAAARLVGRLASLLGQPPVLGEIVSGILLGPTLCGGSLADTLFPVDVRPFLGALADIGLVLFMFVVGLEFDFGRLRGAGRIVVATSVGSTLLPFGLGTVSALFLARGHHPADRTAFTLFVGVAVSVTAFPVLARILTDRGMHRTRLGAIALSSAAVCDLAAWTMLALVQATAGEGGRDHWRVLLVVPFALLLRCAVRPVLSRLLDRWRDTAAAGPVSLVCAGLLASAGVTQAIGLHFVFGAFLFGLTMPREGTEEFRERLLERVETATALLLPVYFVTAGLGVDLSRVGATGLAELALIMTVAVTGKFAGAFLGARSQGLAPRRSAVLATLMNTRGLTELIALSVGLQMGVLDEDLYALMVVMAVVTTAMSGPLLRWLAGPRSMDDAPRPGHSLVTRSR